ncbi:MAG: HAMP domain-containing sensor histidine kinase [Thermodesulfobacteriota bacterium]
MNPLKKKFSHKIEKGIPEEPRRDATDSSELQKILSQWSPLALIGKITPEVIHDINNLLTGILGYSELLSMKTLEDEGLKKGLNTISFSAEKCKVLLGRILSLSRPEGSARFGDVNEWLEETLDLRRCALRHQQIEVVKEFSAPLPVISADGTCLQKALLSLIFVAEEALAGQDGERKIILRTAFEAQNQTISIKFIANGVGMDFARLARLLRTWTEAETMEQEKYFGVQEAKQWIEKTGGTLALETDQNQGPVFIIRLPVKGKG